MEPLLEDHVTQEEAQVMHVELEFSYGSIEFPVHDRRSSSR
jgi:hypothetical protein